MPAPAWLFSQRSTRERKLPFNTDEDDGAQQRKRPQNTTLLFLNNSCFRRRFSFPRRCVLRNCYCSAPNATSPGFLGEKMESDGRAFRYMPIRLPASIFCANFASDSQRYGSVLQHLVVSSASLCTKWYLRPGHSLDTTASCRIHVAMLICPGSAPMSW